MEALALAAIWRTLAASGGEKTRMSWPPQWNQTGRGCGRPPASTVVSHTIDSRLSLIRVLRPSRLSKSIANSGPGKVGLYDRGQPATRSPSSKSPKRLQSYQDRHAVFGLKRGGSHLQIDDSAAVLPKVGLHPLRPQRLRKCVGLPLKDDDFIPRRVAVEVQRHVRTGGDLTYFGAFRLGEDQHVFAVPVKPHWPRLRSTFAVDAREPQNLFSLEPAHGLSAQSAVEVHSLPHFSGEPALYDESGLVLSRTG